ncbi:MAG: magnesium-translocating P-type ATPase [Erysipelotrichaceae bacterium]|nr:magnesium-translocating P-type ATPase [Erysipelotrichaceae bacterium]
MKKINRKEENATDLENRLKAFSSMSQHEIYDHFSISNDGLDAHQIEEGQEKYGPNVIRSSGQDSVFTRIRESLINPFNIVLLAVVIVTYFTDVVIATKKSYATIIMLVVIVLISSVTSFIQSQKSDSAAKALQQMIVTKVNVVREGMKKEISIEDCVPGDIVILGSGDLIPGDVRLFDTKDLFVDQAQLTGESNPVEKYSEYREADNITDLANIGFMGCDIVSGSAKAVILSTGNDTYFGSMSKSLSSVNQKSVFDKNMDSISGLLIRFILVMIPVIFAANYFTKHDLLGSLIFAITIAVGILPEMLPVMMTSSLAKGAISMSKKQTIVKHLGSIQTFGEMDILCTDKTGTLTQDEIVLEKYLDASGREDIRILRHAFLNSYFQTGLKNLMDRAIIKRAEKEGLDYLKRSYVREDEIPFDFTRRKMSVVLRDRNLKRQLITKGAVDEIISNCSFVEIDGEVKEMTEELMQNAYKISEDNGAEGIRVIAVAQKNEIPEIGAFSAEDEKDMVLIGFIGFLDPPKESAVSAIEALKNNGIRTVVLTGDSQAVAINICNRIGIDTTYSYIGSDIDMMNDGQLKNACRKCQVFAKLNPLQKKKIVEAYQQLGHVVGYMGDGINDAPPLKQADVGISVDSAVDIAKEVADIILLEKDLNVLDEGVIEGRRTFTNMNKYLKMAISGNFGNMISVLVASLTLPFLPLKPIHILVQNILNDFAQLGMPYDNVEKEYITEPMKWDMDSLKRFMICFGLTSTILDLLCFAVLWFIFGYNTVDQADRFQCGWFIFGVISQTLVIHTIRTHKIPFIGGRASVQLTVSTLCVVIITVFLGLSGFARYLDMEPVDRSYIFWVGGLMALYLLITQIIKNIYIARYKKWF